MDIRIDNKEFLFRVRNELDACESYEGGIRQAVREVAGKPFVTDPRSFIEKVHSNQHLGRIHLERAAFALELAGVLDGTAGDRSDLKAVQQKLRGFENAVQLANQALEEEKTVATAIVIKVHHGVVSEIYASDPKVDVTIIDEDENEWLPETSQAELPPFRIYG